MDTTVILVSILCTILGTGVGFLIRHIFVLKDIRKRDGKVDEIINKAKRDASDIKYGARKEAKEIIRTRGRIYEILANHTGQELSKIEKDCDRNLWLSSEESVGYGLADSVLKKMPAPPAE